MAPFPRLPPLIWRPLRVARRAGFVALTATAICRADAFFVG